MNVADLEHGSGMTDDDEEDRKFLLLVALALLLRRMFRKRKFVANMQPRRQLDVAKSMWAKYIKESGPDGHSAEASSAGKRFRRRFR